MKGDGSVEVKKKVFVCVFDEIDSNFGVGVIMRLGEVGKVKVVMFLSGVMMLDIVFGGGLLCGRIVEIYGLELLGKMMLALYAMAEM